MSRESTSPAARQESVEMAERLEASACPLPGSARSQAVYNVYNQRIDPSACPKMVKLLEQRHLNCTCSAAPHFACRACLRSLSPFHMNVVLQDPRNNMPVEPNQQPFPGQRRYISTEREASTIPKGGTETTWVYPSPQMFYNGKPTRFL